MAKFLPVIGTHEILHTAGNEHINDPTNVMYPTVSEFNITPDQINTMKENVPTETKIEINKNQYVTPFFSN